MHFSLKYISKLFAFMLFCIFSVAIYGQEKKSGEIGISVGGSYYLGELNKTPFVGTKISAGVLYRHTFDTRFAITGSATYGSLSGEKENTVFQNSSISSFKKQFYELGGVAEFNFIPFLPCNKKYVYTPYVFGGLAAAYYNREGLPIIFSVPFGMGVKYNLNTKFMLSAFVGMRKTFIDNIDYYYNDPPSDINVIPQWGYLGNKDWYSVFGIALSYKIKYRTKCPAFD